MPEVHVAGPGPSWVAGGAWGTRDCRPWQPEMQPVMQALMQGARQRAMRLATWLAIALAGPLGLAGCAGLPRDVVRPPSQAIEVPEQTPLGRLVRVRQAQAGTTHDSAFRLLDSVELAFSSRLALAEGARRSLDLQYYAIHADASTAVLLARIREAAARGVRVRILLDDFNTAGEDAQVLRLAFEPGIEVRLFNPAPGPRGSILEKVLGSLHDLPRLQQRMHNKLFIADNAWGITGGRNLGDAYFGGDEATRFVDLDVLAAGRVVREMSASFDRYWNDARAYPVQALLSPRDLDRLRARMERQAQDTPDGTQTTPFPPPPSPPAVSPAPDQTLDLQRVDLAWAPGVVMADHPAKIGPAEDGEDSGGDDPPADTVVEGLLALMRQARREVLVVSPYFVPGRQMMQTFEQLQARGVAVRVLTNSLASTDAPAAHAGYARHRPQLLRLGVALHEMRADPADDTGAGRGGSAVVLTGAAGGSKGSRSRASLHAKAVIIDRRLAVIGSMNLDLRSQLQNSEVALVIRSARLSRQAARAIEQSLETRAWRVEGSGGSLRWRAPPGVPFADAAHEPEASLGRRLLTWLLGPLAPDEML